MDDFPADVVILDIGLPGMDGFAVAKKLCEVSRRRPLLVAVTGYGNMEARARSEGFDHYFLKPVDPCVLSDLLRNHAAGRLARPADKARRRGVAFAIPPAPTAGLVGTPPGNPMTTRRPTARDINPKPPALTLFRKSLNQWRVEWKARKAPATTERPAPRLRGLSRNR